MKHDGFCRFHPTPIEERAVKMIMLLLRPEIRKMRTAPPAQRQEGRDTLVTISLLTKFASRRSC
jgi:hypothetical protein